MTRQRIAVALSLARYGLRVFPVRPDKTPHLKRWQAEATTDPEQIALWWYGDYPDALVAYATGPSGVLVVDVDVDKGEGGGEWNLRSAGLVPPPTSLEYKTPSGGRHLVYAAPKGRELTIAQGHPVPGVDIRAGNGYAIYYGAKLREPLALTPAPDWALVDAKLKGDDRAPSATLEQWAARAVPGKASKPLRKVAARIAEHDTDHSTMLEVVAEIVKAGSSGDPGAPALLAETRERYTRHYPDHARAFDAAAEGSVKHHGLAPRRLELSKAERKALRRRQRGDDAEPDAAPARSLYVDVAAVLAGGLSAPEPTEGSHRADGLPLLYAGAVNGFMGPPESAKTLTAVAMTADTLDRGGSALWVDVDHNGAPATISRLVAAGIDAEVLTDPARFRLLVGESKEDLEAAVRDAVEHPPTIAVFDSVGEIMPLYGASSNDADEYSAVHRAVFAPVAVAGAAVLVLDHVAKTAAGSGYASGSGAKKRAIDGALYELKVTETFRPGVGGAAVLLLRKDRHGGIRAKTPGERAAVFRLDSRAGSWTWDFYAPRDDDELADEKAEADVAFTLALEPFPTSKERLIAAVRDATGKGWRAERAAAALTEARRRRASPTTLPLSTEHHNRED